MRVSKICFYVSNISADRAELNLERWKWAKAQEIRYCCPVGEEKSKSHLLKVWQTGQ